MIVVDGEAYISEADIFDLGTLECVDVKAGNIRYYNALDNGDDNYILKHAPHYVGGGSQIFCLDSGNVWKFHKKSDTWYKL